MISSLRKSHAASTRTTATPAAYNDSFSMESYITEQWNEIAMASWKEMRREMADTAPPTGLVVYVLDVSASMAKIKENLAKSVAAVMKVMKCVCPGVAQTVVTYTDFDDDSLMRPPVVEAPFSLDWSPETITNYLNEDVVVRGGGLTGREAFDVALNFVLRELVPSFRHIGNCDASTPVLIFNLTDEDMRLCDNKGVYGRVNTPVYGECDYTCSECDHTEATRSATFFKQRWGMNRPTTAKELKDLLIEKNCWLRCLSYGDNLPPGYTELCKVDGDYGADNDRWQFFLSDENYYHCTYEPVLRMLAKQQWCLFSNVSSTFSATAVLKNVPPHLIEKFVALGEVVEVDPAWNITQAQVEDFKSRIEVPHVCKVSKLVHGGELSSDNFLLSNAYDRVSTLSAYQNRQQECAAELADRFGSGGNVASSLVSLFNTAAENMSEDDIGKTEFGHCLCKGCTKLYGGVKDKLINKDRYIAVQLARYLAKSLFEPMIKDEVMVCVGAALNHVIGAFYNCVATQSSHCFEIQKILSDLKGNRNDGTSSDSRKRAYDIIRNSRAERNVHYDAATAISKMIEKKKETIIKKKKKEDITDDDGDRIVWLYLKNFAYVEREVRNLTKNLTPEQFKRFEMPECYSVVKTIAANIEATVDIADIPESASASSRFVAIPVTELYTLESMNQIISERATKYFDGDTIVAAMTFIPASDALQMLTNLVDTKYGLETKGYSGVKAVAAAVSSESTTDFFAKVGFEALKSFVPAKRRPEGLSTETMFEVVMGDGFEGSLADKLSNKITLSHIAGWAKKYNGTNVLRKKIEHFLVVWSLVKMQKNGICDGYRAFDVKELVFEKESYFTCTTCNMPVLKEERFGVTDMCIRCVKPKDANEFIRSNFGGDGKEKDFAAPEQEGVQPPPSSTTTTTSGGGDGDDDEEEDFAAPKQEGVQPPPSSTTTTTSGGGSGGDGEEEDFAAPKQEGVQPPPSSTTTTTSGGGDGDDDDFAAPKQEGVQPPPSSTTTTTSGGGSGGDGEEEDFAAPKQEGVQPPPSSTTTTTSGGGDGDDGEEEDFAAPKQEGVQPPPSSTTTTTSGGDGGGDGDDDEEEDYFAAPKQEGVQPPPSSTTTTTSGGDGDDEEEDFAAPKQEGVLPPPSSTTTTTSGGGSGGDGDDDEEEDFAAPEQEGVQPPPSSTTTTTTTSGDGGDDEEEEDFAAPKQEGVQPPPSSTTTTTSGGDGGGGGDGDDEEEDFAAPKQEGVQPPPSSTTTSGGDGEEEDFAALKQEGPLKFSNWKLITDKNDADEKIEGKETVTEYKILVERLKSKNKQEKVEAANKIIRTRLNPGVYFTNITTALSAAKACSLMGEGGRKLVHVMLENGVCSIPSAVCLECAVCKSIYKASPLAPAKKQYRLCPWCRTARKFKLAGKPGLELLQKMIVNKKDTVSDNQFLWALEHEVSKLSRGVSSDATEDIENFFKTMREKTPDDNTTMFKEVLKTEISVAKYGRVKIMSEVYDGGPCLLQDKVEWSKFNTEVCEKGLLGYRLDKQWSGWQDMCAAKLDDTWKFVHQTAVKEGARDDLMKTLGVTDFINVKAIGDKIRSIVNRQKSV
nr:MAG: wsv465-like protein [Sesarmops intermedium nimavirus]